MKQIPKKIHYCWFGQNPLPESALKCIASWRKFFPDYEIIEWNESNFDVNEILYTSQAYKAKKYAFVSDYARFKILYEQGGIYFDTDVEVIRPFDDILSRGAFMGRELLAKDGGDVNPGLGLGVESHHELYARILDAYQDFIFLKPDGSQNLKTVVKYATELLTKYGLLATDEIQSVKDIMIYPREYFNPLDDNTGRLRIKTDTHSIHWYSKSWYDNKSRSRSRIARMAHRIFGIKLTQKIARFLRLK